MAQLPDYKFTIISDLARIVTLGSVGGEWSQSGAGQPWVNDSLGIHASSGLSQTQDLQRPLVVLAGKRYRVTMYVICQTTGTLSLFLGPNQPLYYLPIVGSTAPFVVNFEFNGFANSLQFIHVIFFTAGGTVNISFNLFQVYELDSLTRVVQPGGWKSLTKTTTRTPELWGMGDTLEGAIDLVGDDWDWLRGFLKSEPGKLFKCLVEMDADGNGLVTWFNGLLDTTNLNSTIISESYKASLNFLRETEWSRLVSFIDTPIALLANKGVHGLDVIDIKGSAEIMNYASGLEPKLNYQFEGNTTSGVGVSGPTYSLTANQTVGVGFGAFIKRNDGFNVYSGFSAQETLTVPKGAIRRLIGTIQVTWSAGASLFLEANLTGSAWVPLVNGGPAVAINITYTFGNFGFPVRARNNAGATGDIRVDFCTLIISSSEIFFDIRPYSFMPLLVLKAFLARTMGEYDNLGLSTFEDGKTANGVADPAVTMQSPPLMYLPAGVNQGVAGNLYTGGDVSWTQLAGPARFSVVLGAGQVSNLLMKRNMGSGSFAQGTTYFTKGNYSLSISGVVLAGSGTVQIYGVIDQDLYFIDDFVIGAGANVINFLVERLYDGMGFRVVAGGGGANITCTNFAIAYLTPGSSTGVARGQNALNFLTNGLALKTAYGVTPDTSDPQEVNYGSMIRGLLRIFGLGMLPEGLVGSQQKLNISFVSLATLFSGANSLQFFANEVDLVIDSDIIKDRIPVGGPMRSQTKADQDASCAQAEYASNYITQRSEKDLRFEIVLNPALILNQEVGNDQIAMMELSSRTLPGDSNLGNTYRTTQNLTITGSPSPSQPNWLHSEGRIMRRNLGLISSMGSPFFRLIGGAASTLVRVNNAGDSFGAISDADIIFAAPLFTPWLVRFTTSMTYADYTVFKSNRQEYAQYPVFIKGVQYLFYVKLLAYNPTLGTARVEGWLKNAGDFSDDFSDDFDNEALSINEL